jgi:hypothetical protein
MVLGLLFALTAIGCSLTPHAVVAEGFNRPEWRPGENHSQRAKGQR